MQQSRQCRADLCNLVVVDGVPHPRIDALDDIAAECAKHARRLLHASERNVRVDIAAAEHDARSGKRTAIVARRTLRTDEARTQSDDGAIAPRIAGCIFERETAALGKAEQDDLLRGKAIVAELADERVDLSEGARQMRLVLLDGRKKRVRIPGPARCLWCEISHVRLRENLSQIEHSLRCGAAAMKKDHANGHAENKMY